jgi:heat shock protein HtpX
MSANFWELQRRARKKTTIYLSIFITITLAMAILIEITMRHLAQENYPADFPMLGVLFLAITFGVALFQYSMFQSYGGSYVAKSVGGKQIDPATQDPSERQLLNIVEEIAIASSLPTPPIFILDSEQINAFAAGLTKNHAAIAITRGALYKLNRDEVQGVIAHEFGHIYNGDMKISMRLAAMVMGFFFVLYIAFRFLQFSSYTRGSRDNRRNGGNPVLLAALLLMGAGAITWLAGSVLKAMVSREREYLADACAVQFTRNPDGIANALRKIGKDQVEDMPKQGMAYSHMYLDNHHGLNSLFATHPPLDKRIQAILGLEYLPPEWKKDIGAS